VSSLVSARRAIAPADLAMVAPAVVYVALFAAVGAWYPYQSVLLASRGLDFAEIGLLLALNAVVGLVAAPIWGAIADRAGIINVPLLVTSIVAAAGAAWLAFANDVASTAAALSVMAVGTAGLIPLTDTRTVELAGTSRERFARARAFGSAAFVGGAVLTGVLLSGRSPDALFVLFVPLLLVTGLAGWRLLAPRAGVAGRPDPEWGEAIVAFVVLSEDVEPDQLRDWCRARLAGFKVPKRVVAVESLPRNANGKLLRDRLPGVI